MKPFELLFRLNQNPESITSSILSKDQIETGSYRVRRAKIIGIERRDWSATVTAAKLRWRSASGNQMPRIGHQGHAQRIGSRHRPSSSTRDRVVRLGWPVAGVHRSTNQPINAVPRYQNQCQVPMEIRPLCFASSPPLALPLLLHKILRAASGEISAEFTSPFSFPFNLHVARSRKFCTVFPVSCIFHTSSESYFLHVWTKNVVIQNKMPSCTSLFVQWA